MSGAAYLEATNDLDDQIDKIFGQIDLYSADPFLTSDFDTAQPGHSQQPASIMTA